MSSLYCFLPSEGLIFLKRGYLPFHSPDQLLDPWMQFKCEYQKQKSPGVANEDFHQHLRQQYQNLPDKLRSMISFEYFEKQSQAKREQIEKTLVAKKEEQVPVFNRDEIQDWRVLELFSSWQSFNLWQQYGASGEGLALEFDAEYQSFRSESYNEQAQHFSVINSVDSWNPDSDLYYFFNRPKLGEDRRTYTWRLVRQLKAADRKVEVQGAMRAMYRLPCKAIKQVIIGYGCSAEYCQQVKRYLSQDIHYRHVICVQAQLNPRTMTLEQVPC